MICIDDSGQDNAVRRGTGSLRSLGAVVVGEKHVTGYVDALASIKDEAGIPVDEEIKWKPSRGSRLAAMATADPQLLQNIRRQMLVAAAEHDVRTIVVTIDRSRAYTQTSDVELGGTLLSWLFERVTMMLGTNERGIALDLAPLLAPLMHRNSLGHAGGAGLAFHPYRHNLLHWIFGETTWSKARASFGVPLPHAQWPYASEDGMPG